MGGRSGSWTIRSLQRSPSYGASQLYQRGARRRQVEAIPQDSFELPCEGLTLRLGLEIPMKANVPHQHALSRQSAVCADHVELPFLEAPHEGIQEHALGAAIAPRIRIELVEVRIADSG